jgi:hypothetical protein
MSICSAQVAEVVSFTRRTARASLSREVREQESAGAAICTFASRCRAESASPAQHGGVPASNFFRLRNPALDQRRERGASG